MILLMTCVMLLNLKILLFMDDINIFGSPHDCSLLQMDIDSVCGWHMKLMLVKPELFLLQEK
jgi:hypothetical protein